jgi:hypothetical protein
MLRAVTADALEMVALPRSSTMSLSIPRGPRVVAMVCATARQAEMLLSSCGVPCDESVPSVCQLTRTREVMLPPKRDTYPEGGPRWVAAVSCGSGWEDVPWKEAGPAWVLLF